MASTTHLVAPPSASTPDTLPSTLPVKAVGSPADRFDYVATSLGGPADDGVSVDNSLLNSPLLVDDLRPTAVNNVPVGIFFVVLKPDDGIYTQNVHRGPALDMLTHGIDEMFTNIYPVTSLDRTVRVYDDELLISSHQARTQKSPNHDLDLLEREWRLRHYDRFNRALHPLRVTPPALSLVPKLYTGLQSSGSGRKIALPPRTELDRHLSFSLYQADGVANMGVFATPRSGEAFELLSPVGKETPHVQLIAEGDYSEPLLLKNVSAKIRRGNRSSTGPVDSFDPFTVYVGCGVRAFQDVETYKTWLNGPVLYRPCPLRMDVTSIRDTSEQGVGLGDFTRGGKMMKRDVLAAVEDGLAGVVRLAEFYASWFESRLPYLEKELLSVRCAEWYTLHPRGGADEHRRPLRVVIELARPGVPFASVSVFTVMYKYKRSADGVLLESLIANDDDQQPTQCLLRRRFFSTFSGLDTSRTQSRRTIERSFAQLHDAVDALVSTLPVV